MGDVKILPVPWVPGSRTKDLVISTFFVPHPEKSNGPCLKDATRKCWLADDDHGIDGIPILAIGPGIIP